MQNTYKIAPDELQSLNRDPEITYTIKQNPYKANVEIEGKERVLAPDMAGLYLARGKKHSRGGMDVYLPSDSFVFSDDKDLSFDENDHDLYELKKGGNFKKTNNTPSRVLKRNVDEKHYNTLIQKLSDPKTDDFEKRTAALMLNKYEDALGKVAFIQEGKKDFPTGIPEFAQNTAPVYETHLKQELDQQKQYMKQGGYTLGTGGPSWLKAWRTPQTPAGKITSTGQPSVYEHSDDQLFSDYNYWKNRAGRDFKDARDFQSYIYDETLKNNPDSVAHMWSKWGQTNGNGDNPLINRDNAYKNAAPNVDFLGRPEVRDNFLDKPSSPYLGARTMFLASQRVPEEPFNPINPHPTLSTPVYPAPASPSNNPVYKPLEDSPNRSRPINWEFNKYQKQDMMFDGLQWASAKEEFPYRSQVQSPLVELERLNPQAALNQVDNSVNNAYRNSRAVNPYLAIGSNQEAFGQGLDSKAQIQSQYDNQNVQIANQQNLTNNQIQGRDQQFNTQSDQQYWRDSIEGRKNFDNLKDYAFNNFRNTRNRAIEQNQQLAYGLAAYGDYQPFDYDFKTGQYRLTGRANVLDQNGSPKSDYLQTLIERISNSNIDETKKLDLLTKLGVSKQLTLPPRGKKGGYPLKNPYKA